MVSTRLRAFYSPFIGFLPQLGLAALLFVGGKQVIDNQISWASSWPSTATC